MKTIIGKPGRPHVEYFVVELSEPTKIQFSNQVEDVLLSSPDIDILFGFDYEKDEDFTKDNAMLLKPYDNLKELNKERCTSLYLMPRNDEKGMVFISIER